MKREGRIHGCNVRLVRRAWGDRGYRGKVTFNKPTNQSKCTMKHPVPSVAQVVYNEHENPFQKSIGKTRGALKAKDLDITRNHLMQDWSIYDHGVPVDEDQDNDVSDDAYHDPEQWSSSDYGNGGHDDEEEENEDEEQQEESWGPDYSSRSRMVLPIESLLTVRKRKLAPPKANPDQQRRPQQLTLTDAVGVAEAVGVADAVGVAEIMIEEVAREVATADDDNNNDQFESWLGLGFYDEEEVPDDWFLITEGEDFAVAA